MKSDSKRKAPAPPPKPDRPKAPGRAPANLTANQRKHLRGLGHELSPLVLVGKDGITDGVIESVREALIDHELVKVKLNRNCDVDKDDAASQISTRAGAAMVQRIGKTMLLYAPHPDKPVIELPRG
jgi:RNA-binding protein